MINVEAEFRIMKSLKHIIAASLLLLSTTWTLQSCEQTPESVNIDAQDISVVGAKESQMKVVSEIYQLTQRETSKGSGMWILNLRFKLNTCTEALNVTDAPTVLLLDEAGMPIEGGTMKLGSNAMDTKSLADFTAFAAKDDESEQNIVFYLNVTTSEEVACLMQQTRSFLLQVGEEESAVVSSDGDAEATPAKSGIEAILPPQLQGKVEVVSVGDVAIDEHAYPTISVTFKLLTSVNTASLVSQYGQLWIVGVAQDASGRDITALLPTYKQWRTNDSDGKEFKQFLEGTTGSTITMHFTGDNGLDPLESDDAKISAARQRVSEAADQVAKFKLKLDAD